MKRPDGVRPAQRLRPEASTPPTESSSSEQTGEPTEPITIISSLRLPTTGKAEKRGAPSAEEPARARRRWALPTAVELPGAQRRAVTRAARERKRFERGEVKRFTKRARRRRITLLTVLGSLVALAVLVAVAAYSPLMAVRTIEISGTQRVDAAAIEESLSDQRGVPLTLVDRSAIGRVLGEYPLIQSYSVQTRPPGTLVVSIVERTPVGVVADGARFDLVDSAGVVIETADAAQAGYPTITTPTGGASGAAFRATARVLLTLPEALKSQVTAATATTGDDVSITLQNGSRVVWGDPGDSALKAVVLEKLMAATDPATVASYDVSSPEAAVVARR